jgi:hypothetical protein
VAVLCSNLGGHHDFVLRRAATGTAARPGSSHAELRSSVQSKQGGGAGKAATKNTLHVHGWPKSTRARSRWSTSSQWIRGIYEKLALIDWRNQKQCTSVRWAATPRILFSEAPDPSLIRIQGDVRNEACKSGKRNAVHGQPPPTQAATHEWRGESYIRPSQRSRNLFRSDIELGIPSVPRRRTHLSAGSGG